MNILYSNMWQMWMERATSQAFRLQWSFPAGSQVSARRNASPINDMTNVQWCSCIFLVEYHTNPYQSIQIAIKLHAVDLWAARSWDIGMLDTESDLKLSSCSQDTLPSGFGTHKHPRATHDVWRHVGMSLGGLLVANNWEFWHVSAANILCKNPFLRFFTYIFPGILVRHQAKPLMKHRAAENDMWIGNHIKYTLLQTIMVGNSFEASTFFNTSNHSVTIKSQIFSLMCSFKFTKIRLHISNPLQKKWEEITIVLAALALNLCFFQLAREVHDHLKMLLKPIPLGSGDFNVNSVRGLIALPQLFLQVIHSLSKKLQVLGAFDVLCQEKSSCSCSC